MKTISEMKSLQLPIILVACVAAISCVMLLFVLINNSQETLASRLSQSFFTSFTIIPISITSLGVFILSLGLHNREFQKNIKFQIIIFGYLVILIGISSFRFYLID